MIYRRPPNQSERIPAARRFRSGRRSPSSGSCGRGASAPTSSCRSAPAPGTHGKVSKGGGGGGLTPPRIFLLWRGGGGADWGVRDPRGDGVPNSSPLTPPSLLPPTPLQSPRPGGGAPTHMRINMTIAYNKVTSSDIGRPRPRSAPAL